MSWLRFDQIYVCVCSLDCCPVDKVALSVCVANLAVSEQIGELYINCRYGVKLANGGKNYEVNPAGCPVTLKINARKYGI